MPLKGPWDKQQCEMLPAEKETSLKDLSVLSVLTETNQSKENNDQSVYEYKIEKQ
jgi:hypothetical protein